MEDVLPQNEETTEEEVDMWRGQRSSAQRSSHGNYYEVKFALNQGVKSSDKIRKG